MPGTPFAYTIDHRGGAAVIHISGDVNRSAGDGLDAAYEESGAGDVVLDFADVDYINSTGIALLVGVLAKSRAAGRAVRACGLSPHYVEIFNITRIADFMAIYDDEQAAVAAG
jgi:anti-sigma B factor antagonist